MNDGLNDEDWLMRRCYGMGDFVGPFGTEGVSC